MTAKGPKDCILILALLSFLRHATRRGKSCLTWSESWRIAVSPIPTRDSMLGRFVYFCSFVPSIPTFYLSLSDPSTFFPCLFSVCFFLLVTVLADCRSGPFLLTVWWPPSLAYHSILSFHLLLSILASIADSLLLSAHHVHFVLKQLSTRWSNCRSRWWCGSEVRRYRRHETSRPADLRPLDCWSWLPFFGPQWMPLDDIELFSARVSDTYPNEPL